MQEHCAGGFCGGEGEGRGGGGAGGGGNGTGQLKSFIIDEIIGEDLLNKMSYIAAQFFLQNRRPSFILSKNGSDVLLRQCPDSHRYLTSSFVTHALT